MAKAARTQGSSIYPAVQNIILACRAFGLGTVLTTIHAVLEDEVKDRGLPPTCVFRADAVGYPRDKHGPVRRLPLTEVICLDSFGKPWPG